MNRYMKKKLAVWSAAVLTAAVLTVSALTACNPGYMTETSETLEPFPAVDQAASLYETLLDNLFDTPAVTLRTEMTYEVALSGDIRYSATYSATEVFSDVWEDSMLVSYDATVTSACRSGGPQVCSTASDGAYRNEYRYRKGFADGYMFLDYTCSGLRAEHKSPISAESYRALVEYIYGDNFVSYLNYDQCDSASRSKREDGSWELYFAGLCEEDLRDLDVLYGPDFSCVSDYVYITDAAVTVFATEDFKFDRARIEMTYSEYDEEGYFAREYPAVVYELTFEERAAVTASDIPLESYTDIGDLRMLHFFTNGLDNRGYADSGAYTYGCEEYWTEGAEEIFCKQDQTIRFDFSNGKQEYEATGHYETPDEAWILTESYRNGILTYKDTNTKTGKVEESTYRATPEDILWDLSYFVWPSEFSGLNVERIECADEEAGKYRLRLGRWQRQGYEEYYASEGSRLTDFTAYVDFTFYNGALYEYAYHIDIAVEAAEGAVDTYRQDLYWSFEKVKPVRP